ncbi:lanthionine synthetase LanC family protein [Marivirga lumbricoides]
MKNSTRGDSSIYEALISLANNILANAKEDEKGIYWETEEVSMIGMHWQSNGTLFTGSAGITLFFIELYQFTGNIKYMNAAKRGSSWIKNYAASAKIKHPAFHIGNTGIAFVLTKMYEVTQESNYLDEALSIIKETSEQIKRNDLSADLIRGSAGILLSLTYLHSIHQNDILIPLIEHQLNQLIQSAMLSKTGIKWDYKEKNINSLCGVSHGASGIAYVFLVLGKYFQNEAFYWLAEQGFRYEREYYNKDINNWEDLRLVVNQEKAITAYKSNNMDYFLKGRDTNCWSHGAAGIGVVRLFAHHLIGNTDYLDEAEKAILKTWETDIQNNITNAKCNYANGKAGNAELFLEAFCYLDNPIYLEYARQAAFTIIDNLNDINPSNKSQNRQDEGLFLGRTGYAYFFLRFLSPDKVSSILFPKIKGRYKNDSLEHDSIINITVEQLRMKIYGKYFPETITLLNERVKNAFPELIPDYNKKATDFIEYLKEIIDREKHYDLKQSFELEHTCYQIFLNNTSYLYTATRNACLHQETKEINKLDESEIVKKKVKLCNNIVLKVSEDNNLLIDSIIETKFNNYFISINQRDNTSKKHFLSSFSYKILYAMKDGIQISKLVADFLKANENSIVDTETEKIQTLLINQVRAFAEGRIVCFE